MKNTSLIILSLIFAMFFSISSDLFSGPKGDAAAPNLVANGDFSYGANQWYLWANDANASLAVEKGEAKITITAPGPHLWSIGLSQTGIQIQEGESYIFTFQARAGTERTILAAVQMEQEPWTNHSGDNMFRLTGKMREFSFPFTMYYTTDNKAVFQFLVGAEGGGTIYIDNITLTKAAPAAAERNYPLVRPSVDKSNIIIYQIIPGSYNGGFKYGGNCFKGIISRLDKIKELGVNCIWLTPVFAAAGLGYNTHDHYRIEIKLGMLNDLKELIYEAHQRDIMLILDLVLNHTWTQHPFFQDVLKNKSSSKYKDYYLWKGKPGESDYIYYFEWKDIPNLNLKNAEVREYLYGVAAYWLKKLDIDGYRVDCAWALEERFPGFGAEMKKRLAAIKPDVFLLAEGNVNEARFFKNGYHSAYDWDLRGFGWTDADAFPHLFEGSVTPKKLHDILTRNLPVCGLPLRFIDNHDHPRSASLLGADGSKAAYTIVLTARGYPLVLGGDEVGFAPSMDHEWSQDDPVVWDYDSPLFEYFKKLIAVRIQYLKNDCKQYWIENDSNTVYSSLSVNGANKLIVVVNCGSSGVSATLKLKNRELGNINSLTDLISGSNIQYDGKGALKITLTGYGTKIILVE